MTSGRLTIAVVAAWVTVAAGGFAQSSGGNATPVQVPGQSPSSTSQVETRIEFAAGAVFVDLDGSRAKFRTDRNLRSGFNTSTLLLDLRPVKGTETFFDFATLTAAGIGDSSPYQRADFRMAEGKLYDLKAGYRKYNYFFGLPEFASGQHSEDSVGRSANVSLDLFPDRRASFLLGYRRNQLLGTRFTTQDLRLDAYPVSYPRRLSTDEYLFGVALKSRHASLLFNQSFLRFKDDQELLPNGTLSVGLRGNVLESGSRSTPVRISTPVSRVIGRYEAGKRYDIVGRYLYSGSDLKINRFEDLLNRVGAGGFPVRQIISSSGVSEKPSHNAGVGQSVDITDRLSFHHRFLYETYTLTGFLDTFGVFRFINQVSGAEVDLPLDESGGTVTEYRLARNEAELEYSATRSVSLFGVHRYSDRHMAFGDAGTTPRPVVTITNSGGGGASWIPSSKGRLRAEVEKGTASLAFNRIEPLSFLRWKVRGQLNPTSRLTISGNATLEDNSNDTPDVNYDLDNRQLAAQAVYVPANRLMFTGGYSYYKIRTTTDIVFYALSLLTQGASLYETNTHLAHVQLQAPAGKRLDLRVGYEYLKDTGKTFPLKMHTPRAGLSLHMHPSVSVEIDWQHYSYNETAFSIQDYRANVLAVGLRFKH